MLLRPLLMWSLVIVSLRLAPGRQRQRASAPRHTPDVPWPGATRTEKNGQAERAGTPARFVRQTCASLTFASAHTANAHAHARSASGVRGPGFHPRGKLVDSAGNASLAHKNSATRASAEAMR